MKRRMALLAVLVLLLPVLGGTAVADRIPENNHPRYIGAMRVVRCREYVTLRKEPYKTADALAEVPLGAIVYNCKKLKNRESFVYCEYKGKSGYILVKYLQRAPEYEPPVTSAVSRVMTREEVAGEGEIILEWQDFNISVIAAREFVQEKKIRKEILRIGCFLDGEPLWGHIETLDTFSELPMLKAFIGGTADEPAVMLYDGGYGLTMLNLLSGAEKWTVKTTKCNLGDAAVVAVDEDGRMYIAGTEGPDPVAISPEGRVVWKAEKIGPEVTGPFEITLKDDGIEVKYAGDLQEGCYIALYDYMGDLSELEKSKK